MGLVKKKSATVISLSGRAVIERVMYKGQGCETVHTHSYGEDKGNMIILSPGPYCVIEGKTHAKYIKEKKVYKRVQTSYGLWKGLSLILMKSKLIEAMCGSENEKCLLCHMIW